MEFNVEFYETLTGGCPVREFLDELKRATLTTLPPYSPDYPSCGAGNIIASRSARRLATDCLSCVTLGS